MQPTQDEILLVSASPRRRALLEAAGLRVTVRVSSADETWPRDARDAEAGAIVVARRKLACAAGHAGLALAADTVVLAGGEPLGKPADPVQAAAMIEQLSGRRHDVVTGFCLARGRQQAEGAVRTAVWFRPLSRLEIDAYVTTGEPLDKAGAYAIQGRGGAFVERIEGSYTNVVGLPLEAVLPAMESLR